MASIRLLKMSRPLGLGFSQEMCTNSDFSSILMRSRPRQILMCLDKADLIRANPPDGCSGSDRKFAAAKAARCASTCVVVSEPKTDKGLNLSIILANISHLMSRWMKLFTEQRSWGLHVQTFFEKAIIDCRFFALLAVAGSLLGSVLCYVEGCVLMLESYFQYFHSISQMLGQGHVVFQLIEAIDMFLMGTAMLIFGTALHVMFVGSNNIKSKGSQNPALSGNFNLDKLQSWMGMDSVLQAKTKIGHAVIMILQVEVLEKCKSISMTDGLDLAYFAGVIFLSSASVFLLSRITAAKGKEGLLWKFE